MISAIAIVDNNFGIGYHNKLLFHIEEDAKLFKKLTLNNVIIMGRNTLESLPNGKPLKDRINIVLTSDEELLKMNKNDSNIVYASCIDEAIYIAELYNKEIFVIGGESVYNQMLNYCNRIYLTKVNLDCIADKYFPDITGKFELVEESELKQINNLSYKFCVYNKI